MVGRCRRLGAQFRGPLPAVELEARYRERHCEFLPLDVVDHVLVEGAQHDVWRDFGDPAVQLPVAVAALGWVTRVIS